MNTEIDDDKIIYLTLCVMQELESELNRCVNIFTLIQILKGHCTDDLNVWTKLTCYGCLSNFDFEFDNIFEKILDNKYATLFLEGVDTDAVIYTCTQKGIEHSSKYECDNALMDSYVTWDENNKCPCNNKNILHCNDKKSERCDLAKEQLIKWFFDDEQNNGQINYECLAFDTMINKYIGRIGYVSAEFSFKKEKIFKDYPIVECAKYNSVQNIWNGDYKKHESTCDNNGSCSPSPTIEWCVKNGLKPNYSLDVAMSQNGKLVCGVIILDKHKLKCDVISMIYDTITKNNPNEDIIIVLMSANWILNQKTKPEKLMVYESLYCCGKTYANPSFVSYEPFKNTRWIKGMITKLNEGVNGLKMDGPNIVNDVNVVCKTKPKRKKKKTAPKQLKK
jgi:hypothetical protein